VLFAEFAEGWRASLAGVADVRDYGAVDEAGRTFPLLSASTDGGAAVVVTAGFHGDEKAGPLTLLAHAATLCAEARALGVGLRIYPCVNPSGFEAHTRYNASGERPNNDFLRYEIAPGVWRGELHEGETPLAWRALDGGPKETVALARELARFPVPVAALDLHQDNFVHGHIFY
jgi:predicted deacylase